VVRAIEATGNKPPGVVVGGHDDELIALEAMWLGLWFLSHKPFDIADIMGTLDPAMSAKRYVGFPTRRHSHT
jgi:FixJ family two-component response regulator